MRLLLIDDSTRLGVALAEALPKRPDSSLTIVADPRDPAAVAAAASTDVIVLVVPPLTPCDDDLDALDRATRGLYDLLLATTASRLVLVTSLRPFERYPVEWFVTEQWAPRPTTDAADLVPYLAELTAREVTRVRPVEVVVLRFGEIVDDTVVADARAAGEAADSRWLHVEDAVQAVERAIEFTPGNERGPSRWHVFHIIDGGSEARFPLGLAGQPPFGYVSRYRLTDGARLSEGDTPGAVRGQDRAARSARRVVIFGAGGPLAAVTAEALSRDHHLRLTDIRPLAAFADAPPQSPGAPRPHAPQPPHEELLVDVTDPDQVLAAADGMDVIVNCTVVRPHPVEAFRVNLLGAYNVMRAAVTHHITRVVHTGPIQILTPHPAGFLADDGVTADYPPRPGDNLYFVSKFLGQEVCRIFAEEHGIETPTLLFGMFVNPAQMPENPPGIFPFTVSWEDAGEAMRQAVRVPGFPRPFEVLHINADLPHGRFPNDKAKQLLGWQPRDRLDAGWRRPGQAEQDH
jgi:nucleoside-diphosphate-sugar epimerase